MTALDLSGQVKLAFLDLTDNRLPSLAGMHHCRALLQLVVDGNRLTRLSEYAQGRAGRGGAVFDDGPAHSPLSFLEYVSEAAEAFSRQEPHHQLNSKANCSSE